MSERPAMPGGELEHLVLATLWDLGSATARQIYTRIGEPRALVYTTIAKVLDRLFAKRLVARKLFGKAFVYRPRARQGTIARADFRKTLARVVGADPRPGIASLVEAVESIDPDLLDELSAAIRKRKSRRDGS